MPYFDNSCLFHTWCGVLGKEAFLTFLGEVYLVLLDLPGDRRRTGFRDHVNVLLRVFIRLVCHLCCLHAWSRLLVFSMSLLHGP